MSLHQSLGSTPALALNPFFFSFLPWSVTLDFPSPVYHFHHPVFTWGKKNQLILKM